MRALEYARASRERFLAELREFLRIPSVSTQPRYKRDVERAAAWLRDSLRAAGFPCAEIMPTHGHPVVYAEWLAAGPAAPTFLVYGHYDVQPPEPLGEWFTGPFEPVVVGDDIYARGASDDKGQLYIYVKAVEAFRETAGAPPVNLKCLFEGEEETGSPNLRPFIAQHAALLAAEYALISDTRMLGKDMPAIVYGLRGLAYVEVEVTGPAHDLHSGIYGGAVHNPLHALAALVARLHDENGRVAIPGFYDAVRDLQPDERVELAKIPFDRAAWLREAGVQTEWGDPAYTIIERTSARPTLDVNGMWGGYTGPGGKTVLPGKAHAKISMRLVPDQDPDEIVRLLRAYLLDLAPPTVHVAVTSTHGTPGAIVRRDSPPMDAVRQAYAAVFGKEPIFIREGGSIPVVSLLRELLGMDAILLGFGLPDDRLHSPNEKFHLPNFYKGIETVIRFMELMGAT